MNKKGFTLIELLAVIIILGILMIIAIPSVTKYISDSRKSAYIDTAKEIISGARNMVNDGKLEMYNSNTTYYIPSSCIKTENGIAKSPYGEFTKAYVGVIYDGKGYKYYWISTDDAGQGVPNITPQDKLDIDDIESDLKASDIEDVVQTTGIGNRSEIKILDCSTNSWERQYHLDNTSNNVSEENGGGTSGNSAPVCKPATSLHKVICDKHDSLGCDAPGHAGNGNMITYGTIPSGSPKAGDAYDCDVNNDGTYDSVTERFYYVKSDEDKSILIYYTNMNDQTTYAYDTNNQNWHGPRKVYQYLPSTSLWKNPKLIAPGTRNIESDSVSYPNQTSGGTIESFTYEGKAARLITYKEIQSVCGSSGMRYEGYLDNYVWLMENIGGYEQNNDNYDKVLNDGYWIETPFCCNSNSAIYVSGKKRYLTNEASYWYATSGARPVITIKTSDLG